MTNISSNIKHIYIMVTKDYVIAYRPHPKDPVRMYANREDMIKFLQFILTHFKEFTPRVIRNQGLEDHLIKAIENDKKFEQTCFKPVEYDIGGKSKLKITFDKEKY